MSGMRPILFTEDMLLNIPGIYAPVQNISQDNEDVCSEPIESDSAAQEEEREGAKRKRHPVSSCDDDKAVVKVERSERVGSKAGEGTVTEEEQGTAAPSNTKQRQEVDDVAGGKESTRILDGDMNEDMAEQEEEDEEAGDTQANSHCVIEECPAWIASRFRHRGDRTFRDIHRESGVVLRVLKGEPGAKVRRISLRGCDTERVAEAVSMLRSQVKAVEVDTDSGYEDAASLCKQSVNCPNTRVGAIIGKQGVTIKAIQRLSGAKVSVVQHEGETATVNILGSGEEVAVAVDAVAALVQLDRQSAYAYADQIVQSAEMRRQWDFTFGFTPPEWSAGGTTSQVGNAPQSRADPGTSTQEQHNGEASNSPVERELAPGDENEQSEGKADAQVAIPNNGGVEGSDTQAPAGAEEQKQEAQDTEDYMETLGSSSNGWIRKFAKHPDGSDMVYYCNIISGASQWERPVMMGNI